MKGVDYSYYYEQEDNMVEESTYTLTYSRERTKIMELFPRTDSHLKNSVDLSLRTGKQKNTYLKEPQLKHEQPEAVNEFIRWLQAYFGESVPPMGG